jgi:hypothetical protein
MVFWDVCGFAAHIPIPYVFEIATRLFAEIQEVSHDNTVE